MNLAVKAKQENACKLEDTAPGTQQALESFRRSKRRLGDEVKKYFTLKKNFFWPCHVACGILVPGPGTEPVPSAVKVQSPNHRTDREFPRKNF